MPADVGAHLQTQTSLPEIRPSGSEQPKVIDEKPADEAPPESGAEAQGIFSGGRRRLVAIVSGAASAAMLGGSSAQWLVPVSASPSVGASAPPTPVETVTLSGVGDV